VVASTEYGYKFTISDFIQSLQTKGQRQKEVMDDGLLLEFKLSSRVKASDALPL
jgi:hypothetical protein